MLNRDFIAPDTYVSRDGKTIALNVILNDDVAGDRLATVRDIQMIVGQQPWISGVPIFRTRISSDTQRESFILVPFTILAIVAIITLLTRSISTAILPISVGGIGSISVLGALGSCGIPLSLSTSILPSVLLALGCAYAMHVMTAAVGPNSPAELETRLPSGVGPDSRFGNDHCLGISLDCGVPHQNHPRTRIVRSIRGFCGHYRLPHTASRVSCVVGPRDQSGGSLFRAIKFALEVDCSNRCRKSPSTNPVLAGRLYLRQRCR